MKSKTKHSFTTLLVKTNRLGLRNRSPFVIIIDTHSYLCGSVAQLVEQRPEEPCVTGSSPVGATNFKSKAAHAAFFRGIIRKAN